MKKTQTELKTEYMTEAEARFDELMAWDESTPEPDLTQIEEVVLQLRQRLGEQLAQAALERQEKRQPAEKMNCPQCGDELENKGQKDNRVTSRVGNVQLTRTYYYCPGCGQGFFPPGSAAEALGETLE